MLFKEQYAMLWCDGAHLLNSDFYRDAQRTRQSFRIFPTCFIDLCRRLRLRGPVKAFGDFRILAWRYEALRSYFLVPTFEDLINVRETAEGGNIS